MSTIRAATAADVEGVLPMVAAICSLHEAWDRDRYGMLPDVVERYRRWLPVRATDPRSVFLVAEEAGELAGFVVGSVEQNIPIYRVAEFGFVHDLWVQPPHRGTGIASGLAAAAIDRFRAMGMSQVRLETAVANSEARRVFERLGFRAASVELLLALDPQTRT